MVYYIVYSINLNKSEPSIFMLLFYVTFEAKIQEF